MALSVYSENHFMGEAYKQALLAQEEGEVPVGAVITCNNRIIAKAHNQVETLTDATAHAEILAVTAASNYLGTKYLNECTLYVTLEPCTMCAGALFWTQLGKLVYGAEDPQRGFSRLSPAPVNGTGAPVLHPKTSTVKGLMKQECQTLIAEFFKGLRDK